MAERATIDDQAQAPERYYSTSTEDSMNDTIPLSFLGDPTLWTEDVTWLAEHRAFYAFGHLAPRVRWAHLYLEPAHRHSEGMLARIQLDLVGQELCSVVAIRACPQAAICAAFDLLREQIERTECVAV
jgi:hypothetical protein